MAIEPNSNFWRQRYQTSRAACGYSVGAELKKATADIRDPVVKLRFLRDAIDNQDHVQPGLLYRVLQPLRRKWRRAKTLQSEATHAIHHRSRSIARIVLAIGISSTATVIAAYTYKPEPIAPAVPVVLVAPLAQSAPEAQSLALPPVAEAISADTLGVAPTTIWLADRGVNWELYSNGLRIETTYAVNGEARRYRVHDRESGVLPEVRTKPVGILFHTSESDVWPLETGYEKQLRESSAALLKYVREQRAYNYMIDRFGRAYRVVDDETRAHHAGNSVWANRDDVYLDLNSAFLGVSFESRWEGGRAMPITRAQLLAGRNLTNYLRQRFAIAPEMCVTHGLTSVSPKLHLIGYHLDWARGFPFAAFGLPDQYALPPPSIALFGFDYDEEFLRAVGDGWPGALAAQAALLQEAANSGVDMETLRAQRREIFLRWAREAREPLQSSSSTEPPNFSANTATKQRG